MFYLQTWEVLVRCLFLWMTLLVFPVHDRDIDFLISPVTRMEVMLKDMPLCMEFVIHKLFLPSIRLSVVFQSQVVLHIVL
jgi:hypothetical protein